MSARGPSDPGGPFAHVWRDLLATQGSFLRDLCSVAGKVSADPAGWPTRVTELWSRWASPEAWFPRPRSGAPAPAPLGSVSFVVDAAAEATAEREVALASVAPLDAAVIATPLRSVLASGEIAPEHVEARVSGDRMRVALVDLGALRRLRQERRLEPGLYVGALFVSAQARTPVALVQVLLLEHRA